MNKEWELRLAYCSLYGETIGFIKGLSYYNLPEELMAKIYKFAEEREEEFNKVINEEERTDSTHP